MLLPIYCYEQVIHHAVVQVLQPIFFKGMYEYSSLVAQRLKRPPLMRETWVQSLDREHPLEKEVATHASILALRTQ